MYAPKQYRPEKKKRPDAQLLALAESDPELEILTPPEYAALEQTAEQSQEQRAEVAVTETVQAKIGKGVEGQAGKAVQRRGRSNVGRKETPPQFKVGAGKTLQRAANEKIKNEADMLATASGDRLPQQVLQHMNTAFGTNFSDVKIVPNSEQASAVGALAYAQGSEVHFAPGQYNPLTPGGLQLIGHELTHIVQQRQGRVQATTEIGGEPVNDDMNLEAEADRLGALAAQGLSTGITSPPMDADGTVSKQGTPAQHAQADQAPDIHGDKKEEGREEDDLESLGQGLDSKIFALPDPLVDGPQPKEEETPAQMMRGTLQRAQTQTGGPPPQGAPATVVDISNGFTPPADVAAFLNENHNKFMEINAKMGAMAEGKIKVKQQKKGAEDGTGAAYKFDSGQYLEYKADAGFLEPLRAQGILPVIALRAEDLTNITGVLTLSAGGRVLPDPKSLIQEINSHLEALGLIGVKQLQVPGYTNEVANGVLTLMAPELNTEIGGFLTASGTFGLVGNTFVFSLHADIDISGMAQGAIDIERTDEGTYKGEAEIGINIENVTGNVKVVYTEGTVTGRGEGTIESEKFKGSLTLIFDEESAANQAVHEGMGIETVESSQEQPATQQPNGPRVVVGFGSVEVQLTPWLTANATVGIDSQGHVTIHGTMAFPEQIELMEQKDKKHDLFNLEIKAGYGVPLVGQIFLFASLGMFVKAGFGPLALRDIGMEGTYSTDPAVLNNFKITGALGISAYAQVGLQVRAGAGLTLLGHDIKAGIDLDASAGIKAYAEARPTFEYIETADNGQKVGEAHLKGHFEAAAQLFLELAGAFFVELDSPWWSPAPDETWEWPFGSLVYPIGESMGVGADVDWLVGSPEVPELTFSPVEFDPDKFISDMTKEPDNLGQEGKGGDENKDGSWTGDGAGGNENSTEPQLGDPKGGDGPKEDLTKLPDEERYMRSLDEIGKLGDQAKSKPWAKGALKKKLDAVKRKYAIQDIDMVDPADDSVKVHVKHKAQENSNNLIEIKLLSKAEQDQQFSAAVADLETALKTVGHPETGAITKSQAETAAHEIDLGHEVIDGTLVIQDDKHLTIKGDVGEEHRKMTTKPLAVGLEESDGKEDEAHEGEAEVKSESDLTEADRRLHQELLANLKVGVEDEDAYEDEEDGAAKFVEKAKAEIELEIDRIKGKIRKGLKVVPIYHEQESETEGDALEFEVTITPNDSKIKGAIKQNIKNGKYPTGEDPTTRSLDDLWKDVSLRTKLTGEKGDEVKAERIKLAVAELKNRLGNAPMIDAILAHNEGQKPRDFRSAVSEDAVGVDDPHICERHVFGTGSGVDDLDKLAIRVCRKEVGGVAMNCGAVVGAYNNLVSANEAISAAVREDLVANWKSIRMDMIAGTGRVQNNTIQVRTPFSGKGSKLRKNFTGSNVPIADMPPHTGLPGAIGDRPLHPQDEGTGVDTTKSPLTIYDPMTVTFLRVKVYSHVPGGWFIHSSWPE